MMDSRQFVGTELNKSIMDACSGSQSVCFVGTFLNYNQEEVDPLGDWSLIIDKSVRASNQIHHPPSPGSTAFASKITHM